MAFDFFKRKQEKKGADRPKETAAVVDAASDVRGQKETKADKAVEPKTLTLPAGVRRPVISEKATLLQGMGQYVFKVHTRTNKAEVTKAIERHYGVHVTTVRIINIPGKERRMRGVRGWRPGYKKAVVQLKQGETIDAGV